MTIDFVVTLLGTSSPSPSIERFGMSTLVEAGEHRLLFDCGRGAIQRLLQLGPDYPRVDRLFLTHLHSDHIVGYRTCGLLRGLWGGDGFQGVGA